MNTPLLEIKNHLTEAESLLGRYFESHMPGSLGYVSEEAYAISESQNPLSMVRHIMEFGSLTPAGGFEVGDGILDLEPVVEFGTREVAGIVIAAQAYSMGHGVPRRVVKEATAALDRDPDPVVLAGRIMRSAMQRRRIVYQARLMITLLDLMDTGGGSPLKGAMGAPISFSLGQTISTFNQVAYAAKRLHNTAMMALN